MNILITVPYVPGYMLAEIEALLPHASVVVWSRKNNLTPTPESELGCRARWIMRDEVTTAEQLVATLIGWTPDVYLCSGWNDSGYLDAARYYHRMGCRTVLCMDTQWEGTMRQYVNCLRARVCLRPIFDFVWGAGEPQAKYARKLGFRPWQIKTGYYSADTEKFNALYSPDKKIWPHIFLFVGRYAEAKNMRRMERAFLKALDGVPGSDWILRCIGRGPLWDARTIHPRIEHLGYKAPAELHDFVREAGCFVLPSTYEPWGVVVHEFALMGLPLLCSTKIGAATMYLKDGENGFSFDPFDVEAIKDAFVRIMKKSDDELQQMGKKSHALGVVWTTDDWAKIALSFGGNDL